MKAASSVISDANLKSKLSELEAPRSRSERLGVAISMARMIVLAALSMTTTETAWAQTDPWSNAATRMGNIFSGPIAKGFALVAIVVGGLELGFSEGGGRRTVGGLIFGLGMALGAANFISWLFS